MPLKYSLYFLVELCTKKKKIKSKHREKYLRGEKPRSWFIGRAVHSLIPEFRPTFHYVALEGHCVLAYSIKQAAETVSFYEQLSGKDWVAKGKGRMKMLATNQFSVAQHFASKFLTRANQPHHHLPAGKTLHGKWPPNSLWMWARNTPLLYVGFVNHVPQNYNKTEQ